MSRCETVEGQRRWPKYYLSLQALLGFGCFYNFLFCLSIKCPCCIFVLGKGGEGGCNVYPHHLTV